MENRILSKFTKWEDLFQAYKTQNYLHIAETVTDTSRNVIDETYLQLCEVMSKHY